MHKKQVAILYKNYKRTKKKKMIYHLAADGSVRKTKKAPAFANAFLSSQCFKIFHKAVLVFESGGGRSAEIAP